MISRTAPRGGPPVPPVVILPSGNVISMFGGLLLTPALSVFGASASSKGVEPPESGASICTGSVELDSGALTAGALLSSCEMDSAPLTAGALLSS